jgi:hypothetical protein
MATLVGIPAPVNGCVHPKVIVEKAFKDMRKPEEKAPSTNGTNGYHHTNGSTDNSTEDAFKIGSQYAYTPRRMKVITIGAGFSGLLMAHKFQHRFPDARDFVDHQIFEARSDVGGTWLANDYPGVQCDVPAHIYVSYPPMSLYYCLNSSDNCANNLQAFPFDPNPNWERFYASGGDILALSDMTMRCTAPTYSP